MARSNFHLKKYSCLNRVANEYTEAFSRDSSKIDYDFEPGDLADLNLAEATSECDPTQSGLTATTGYAGAEITSLDTDSSLGIEEANEIQSDSGKMGENVGANEVAIGNFAGLNADVSIGSTDISKEGETANPEKESKEISEELKTRNNALTKLKKEHNRLAKSKGLEVDSKGLEDAIIHNATDAYRHTSVGMKSLSGKLPQVSAVSTSEIKEEKEEKKRLAPKKRLSNNEGKTDGKTRNRKRGRLKFGDNDKYAKRYPSSKHDKLLNAIDRNKSKMKKEELDNLWEIVTRAYLIYGVPRLFEPSDKK